MKNLIPQLLRGTPPKPTKTEYTVLRQLVQRIPPGMIQRLADEHKLDIRHITISNIVSNCNVLFAMSGYLQDSAVSNVVMQAPDSSYAYRPEYLPDREHAFSNVLESNIVKG